MPDSTPNPDPELEAFERGRRQARIDSEIEQHEKRLNAINGSIERNVREQTKLRNAIDALGEKIDDIVQKMELAAALEQQRSAQLKRANDQQISNRTFWLGVIAIIAALAAAVISGHGVSF